MTLERIPDRATFAALIKQDLAEPGGAPNPVDKFASEILNPMLYLKEAQQAGRAWTGRLAGALFSRKADPRHWIRAAQEAINPAEKQRRAGPQTLLDEDGDEMVDDDGAPITVPTWIRPIDIAVPPPPTDTTAPTNTDKTRELNAYAVEIKKGISGFEDRSPFRTNPVLKVARARVLEKLGDSIWNDIAKCQSDGERPHQTVRTTRRSWGLWTVTDEHPSIGSTWNANAIVQWQQACDDYQKAYEVTHALTLNERGNAAFNRPDYGKNVERANFYKERAEECYRKIRDNPYRTEDSTNWCTKVMPGDPQAWLDKAMYAVEQRPDTEDLDTLVEHEREVDAILTEGIGKARAATVPTDPAARRNFSAAFRRLRETAAVPAIRLETLEFRQELAEHMAAVNKARADGEAEWNTLHKGSGITGLFGLRDWYSGTQDRDHYIAAQIEAPLTRLKALIGDIGYIVDNERRVDATSDEQELAYRDHSQVNTLIAEARDVRTVLTELSRVSGFVNVFSPTEFRSTLALLSNPRAPAAPDARAGRPPVGGRPMRARGAAAGRPTGRPPAHGGTVRARGAGAGRDTGAGVSFDLPSVPTGTPGGASASSRASASRRRAAPDAVRFRRPNPGRFPPGGGPPRPIIPGGARPPSPSSYSSGTDSGSDSDSDSDSGDESGTDSGSDS